MNRDGLLNAGGGGGAGDGQSKCGTAQLTVTFSAVRLVTQLEVMEDINVGLQFVSIAVRQIGR